MQQCWRQRTVPSQLVLVAGSKAQSWRHAGKDTNVMIPTSKSENWINVKQAMSILSWLELLYDKLSWVPSRCQPWQWWLKMVWQMARQGQGFSVGDVTCPRHQIWLCWSVSTGPFQLIADNIPWNFLYVIVGVNSRYIYIYINRHFFSYFEGVGSIMYIDQKMLVAPICSDLGFWKVLIQFWPKNQNQTVDFVGGLV